MPTLLFIAARQIKRKEMEKHARLWVMRQVYRNDTVAK